MVKLATQIVDRRNLIFLIIAIGLVFSAFSRNWVEVENDLSFYLPASSTTKQGLAVMEEQFITYGSARVMVATISEAEAWSLEETLETIRGVQTVDFDASSAHYNSLSALYDITFAYSEDDDRCLSALDAVKDALADYDVYISTDLGNALSEAIDAEVSVIMVYVAAIVVVVLLLTSQTYAEVPVLVLTFVIAMVLNLGTNFLLGKISFVSNSVTSILQLALSLDYAVIFCNRFKEEHKSLPLREAVIVALSKAIPEIGASCLTTIGGLAAMLFMQFRICLIKSIFFALFSVFVVMPGLLMLFGPLMDKTGHRSFIPAIPFVGKLAYATRFLVPPLFAAVLVFAFHFSQSCPYAYGYGDIETPKLNDTQIAEQMIETCFDSPNMVALVVPAGDYEREAALLDELERCQEVDYALGLANIEAMDGYTLTDRLTPRQFAELADIDYELAQLLYTAYATENDEVGHLLGSASAYRLPLMDIFLFACEQIDAGYVTLETAQQEELDEARQQIILARQQLLGTEYTRMLVYLTLPLGDTDSYPFLDTMYNIAHGYYPEEQIYVVGDMSSEYEFQKSFSTDNTVVSILSILIVLVVLLFTFKSAGMPLLLILVIQGSIWINFSVPAFTGKGIFFMSYIVVSSIQMGANIDYAIVIASRYMEVKDTLGKRDGIIETMNFAFPTIITSGTILAVAGILVGSMTSEVAIVGIGQSLGRGTLISIFLVMFVLPQILLIGSGIIEKTSFAMPSRVRHRSGRGRIYLDGMVQGEVHGTISGTVHGYVDGEVNISTFGKAEGDND